MRAATTIAKAATRLTWPLTRLDRNENLPAAVVLCYHRVLTRPAPGQQARYAVTPEQFHEQMSLLAAEGFSSLTLDEFRTLASGTRELPPRSVLVTFDDGFADTYTTAWPIARELGLKINLFVCTGLINGDRVTAFEQQGPHDHESQSELADCRRALNWQEVRELSGAGVGLGFHGHAHRNYGRLSGAEIVADVLRGLSLMEQQLGRKPISFAFPYGHPGSYSPQAISTLKEHGFEVFFTTEMERTPLPSAGPISRFVIHREDDIRSFRRKLFGGYEWVGKLRRIAYAFGASVGQESRAPSRA